MGRRVIMKMLAFALLPTIWACSEAGPGDTVIAGSECGVDAERQLDRLGVPGLSAVVLKGGEVICTLTAGMANIEEDRPVEPDTLFAWASVSKTLTAAAIMQLVEDGAIGLEDDINDHLPFSVRHPRCGDQPITLTQLLTHTSSIREDEYDGVYADLYVEGDSPLELGVFLKEYLTPGGMYYSEKKNFKKKCPGKSHTYSNVAVGLVGYLVEVVSGQSFEQFSQKRLFEPLGIKKASWRLAELDQSQIAMPYEGKASKGFVPRGHIGFPTYPDGLLRTSPTDLARFLIMFMQFGEFDGKRIFSRATVEAMRREHAADIADGQGLLWYYDNVGSRKGLLGHTGSDPGTSSMMFFDPKDEAGVILVANGSWKWDRAEGMVKKLFKYSRSPSPS